MCTCSKARAAIMLHETCCSTVPSLTRDLECLALGKTHMRIEMCHSHSPWHRWPYQIPPRFPSPCSLPLHPPSPQSAFTNPFPPHTTLQHTSPLPHQLLPPPHNLVKHPPPPSSTPSTPQSPCNTPPPSLINPFPSHTTLQRTSPSLINPFHPPPPPCNTPPPLIAPLPSSHDHATGWCTRLQGQHGRAGQLGH